MRDRRALIARDIGDAGLQQRLGDRENAFAAEDFAGLKPQVLDLALEGPFRHRLAPDQEFICMSIFSASSGVNDGALASGKGESELTNCSDRHKFHLIQLRRYALLRQFHFASLWINSRHEKWRAICEAAGMGPIGWNIGRSCMSEVTRRQTLALGAGAFLTDLLFARRRRPAAGQGYAHHRLQRQSAIVRSDQRPLRGQSEHPGDLSLRFRPVHRPDAGPLVRARRSSPPGAGTTTRPSSGWTSARTSNGTTVRR